MLLEALYLGISAGTATAAILAARKAYRYAHTAAKLAFDIHHETQVVRETSRVHMSMISALKAAGVETEVGYREAAQNEETPVREQNSRLKAALELIEATSSEGAVKMIAQRALGREDVVLLAVSGSGGGGGPT